MQFLRPIGVLVWKDILLELRSRELVVSVVVFGLVVLVVFNFALSVTTQRVAVLAPGILWVAFAFAGVLAMNRAFVREREQGGLDGLLLTPVSRDAIFLGKAAASFVFMLLVEVILLPIFAGLLNFSGMSFTLVLTIVLATLGFRPSGDPVFRYSCPDTLQGDFAAGLILSSYSAGDCRGGRGDKARYWSRDRRRDRTLAAASGGLRRPVSGNMSLGFFNRCRGMSRRG